MLWKRFNNKVWYFSSLTCGIIRNHYIFSFLDIIWNICFLITLIVQEFSPHTQQGFAELELLFTKPFIFSNLPNLPVTWQAILLALPFNGCLWNYNLRKKNIVILKLTCFYLDSHLLNSSDILTKIYWGESLSDNCILFKWWTKILKLNNNNIIPIKLTIDSRHTRKWHFVGKIWSKFCITSWKTYHEHLLLIEVQKKHLNIQTLKQR